MIETVIGDGARADLRLPEAVAAGFAELAAAVTARSSIVWGEHCSECAYPTCYASCAFYTPRADLHCRRFEAGFEPVAGAQGLHRVRFRKWGKLEGGGPVGMNAVDFADAAERSAVAARQRMAQAPLPYALDRSLSWRANERRRKEVALGSLADAESFVIEAWASDGRTHQLTVTFLEVDGPGLFQASAQVTPAYGRVLVRVAEIAARVPLDRPFLVQIEPVGEAAGREIVFGLCDFVRLDASRLATAVATGGEAPVKVVVWDLDETLWTGTLAEDGPEGVTPRPEAVALVRALDERGVLQSVASKNDEAEALAALARHGLAEMFLHPQVGWGPKSDSLKRIAAALDLGLDSVVFLDDQPFERGEVQAGCPAVRTLAHTEVAGLIGHRWFDLPVTPESRSRRQMYRAEAVRAQTLKTTDSDYLAFLRGCEIVLDARPLNAADVERVYELSQRTNQLNFNGTKLSREQVTGLLGGERLALTLRCTDRFGDYGLIGFMVADLRAGLLEEVFMSCRVQRKRVEHAALALLAGRMRAAGAASFDVRFRRTERNGAGLRMLEDLGFAPPTAEDGVWSRPLGRPFDDAEVVRLAPALAQAA